MSNDITAIVLAGGRSTRFGADKLAAELGAVSVLDRAIVAVAHVATDVVVVGSASTAHQVRRVDDPEPFGGPLQALAGGLAVVDTPLAIVVAGDMPSLVPSVLVLLVETLAASSAIDAVVLVDPRDAARRQPLPLAIRIEQAGAAAAASLGAGDRSLVRLLGRLRLLEIPPDRWLSLDPEALTLIDIDVPDDLQRARDVASDQRNR